MWSSNVLDTLLCCSQFFNRIHLIIFYVHLYSLNNHSFHSPRWILTYSRRNYLVVVSDPSVIHLRRSFHRGARLPDRNRVKRTHDAENINMMKMINEKWCRIISTSFFHGDKEFLSIEFTAITITVLFSKSVEIAFKRLFSVEASSALVASSNTTIEDFRSIARAIQSSCNWPEEKFSPPSFTSKSVFFFLKNKLY